MYAFYSRKYLQFVSSTSVAALMKKVPSVTDVGMIPCRAANNFYLERTYVRLGHHFGRTKGKFGRT